MCLVCADHMSCPLLLLLLPSPPKAFAKGVGPFLEAVQEHDFLHATKLTLMLAAIAVPLNTVFGTVAAILITRNEFPGKVRPGCVVVAACALLCDVMNRVTALNCVTGGSWVLSCGLLQGQSVLGLLLTVNSRQQVTDGRLLTDDVPCCAVLCPAGAAAVAARPALQHFASCHRPHAHAAVWPCRLVCASTGGERLDNRVCFPRCVRGCLWCVVWVYLSSCFH